MTIAYRELLPTAYLLVLAPGPPDPREHVLAHELRQAARSGRAAVWVDCRLLPTLSCRAVRLLRAWHGRLRASHARLVLCRVPDYLAQALPPAAGPAQVFTLDEAGRL